MQIGPAMPGPSLPGRVGRMEEKTRIAGQTAHSERRLLGPDSQGGFQSEQVIW